MSLLRDLLHALGVAFVLVCAWFTVEWLGVWLREFFTTDRETEPPGAAMSQPKQPHHEPTGYTDGAGWVECSEAPPSAADVYVEQGEPTTCPYCGQTLRLEIEVKWRFE